MIRESKSGAPLLVITLCTVISGILCVAPSSAISKYNSLVSAVFFFFQDFIVIKLHEGGKCCVVTFNGSSLPPLEVDYED